MKVWVVLGQYAPDSTFLASGAPNGVDGAWVYLSEEELRLDMQRNGTGKNVIADNFATKGSGNFWIEVINFEDLK